MTQIESVVPKENYILDIQLSNGNRVILNMENRLSTIRFGLLKNKEFFDKVTTDGNFIRWENKVEISVNEVFQLVQK